MILRELGDVRCSQTLAEISLNSQIFCAQKVRKKSQQRVRVEQSEALSQAQGKGHMEEFGVTLPPARSYIWSFDLMSMHIYQIWDPLLGGKHAS